MKSTPRCLIVCEENGKWYVRRVKFVTHYSADDADERCYVCDEPIANDLATLKEASDAAEKWLTDQSTKVK